MGVPSICWMIDSRFGNLSGDSNQCVVVVDTAVLEMSIRKAVAADRHRRLWGASDQGAAIRPL